MQVVPLQCPLCAGLIQIDASLAGQQVACPLCQQTIQLPPAEFFAPAGPPAPPELPPGMPSDLVQLACPVCTGWLAVPAAMSGRQVGCPHCASSIMIGLLAPSASEWPTPSDAPASGTQPPTPPAPGPREASMAPVGSPGLSATPASTADRANERMPPFAKPSDRRPPQQTTTAPTSDRLPPGKSAPVAPSGDRLPPGASGVTKPVSERLPPSRLPASEPKPPTAAATDAPVAKNDPGTPAAKTPAAALGAPAAPPQEKPADAAPDIAALLPPGAEDWRPSSEDLPAEQSPKRSERSIEELLPPGADGAAGVTPGEQVEVPDAPRRRTAIAPNLPKGTVAVPTPDGGFVTVTESPAVIGEGDEEIEVRRLTPQEKARRRFRRNLILWSASILILLAVTWWLVGR